MEDYNITKEQVIEDLKDAPLWADEFEKYLAVTELPKELAELVFAAYTKGISMYISQYYDEQSKRQAAEKRYADLAIKIVEKQYGLE